MSNEVVITIGLGIFCSTCGWVVNNLYSRQVAFRERKTERYQTALSEFYWPLYCNLLELQGLRGDIENPHNEEEISNMFENISSLVRDKMGHAFPKKAVARPIITLITLLHRGNQQSTTLKYVPVDCLNMVISIIESRLFTMSKKYDYLCDEKEDRYTYALYSKIINQNTDAQSPEWINHIYWWFHQKKCTEMTKINRDNVIQLFSDTIKNTVVDNKSAELSDIEINQEDIELDSFSAIGNPKTKRKHKKHKKNSKGWCCRGMWDI